MSVCSYDYEAELVLSSPEEVILIGEMRELLYEDLKAIDLLWRKHCSL